MLTKEQVKYRKIATWVSIVMLILAVPAIWPYAYFQLLRLVVTASAAYIAWLFHNSERSGWMWGMIGIAVLYNPFVPFFLVKETWVLFDLIVAVIFYLSLKK
jgi:hypothetical protein